MIRLEDVAVSFGHRQILERLSFHVADGEKVALVGSNGTGKTTILKLLTGELEPDLGMVQRPAERVCHIPQHISSTGARAYSTTALKFLLSARELDRISRRIREIESRLESGEGSHHELEELEELHELFLANEGYRAEADIRQLLDGVGLDRVGLDRAVSSLSGGQRTKLMLCHMLYRKSDVLLLDEPTNHIEPTVVVWLATYLAGLRKTVIAVSHNPAFLDIFVKRIISLEGTPTKARSYRGNYSDFLQQKSTRELSEQRQQTNLRDEIDRQEMFIRDASQHQVGLMRAREKSVERLKRGCRKQDPFAKPRSTFQSRFRFLGPR